jgi:hypothetical protein
MENDYGAMAKDIHEIVKSAQELQSEFLRAFAIKKEDIPKCDRRMWQAKFNVWLTAKGY